MLTDRSAPGIDAARARARACLVAGCACRDPRVLSRRHAAFVAAHARATGQTADRIVAADPAWRFLSSVGPL